MIRILGLTCAVLAGTRMAAADVANPTSSNFFGNAVVCGTISHPAIQEGSGVAPSRLRGDVLWLLNDSGNRAELFAVSTNGNHLATVRLDGEENEDWEDLASFRLDGTAYLLVGDCGDNPGFRTTCRLHVVPEPNLTGGGPASARPAWSVSFRYEDGPRDCESIAVDPAGARVLLLSKREVPPVLYELPLRPPTNAVATARKVGPMTGIPEPAGGLKRGILARIGSQPTAMDLDPTGRRLAVLTYENAYLFVRGAAENWTTALGRGPTVILLPDPLTKIVRKREAMCWSADGRDLFVTGEGSPVHLLRVPGATP